MNYLIHRLGAEPDGSVGELTTKMLYLYWERLVQSGMNKHAFYDGSISTVEEFLGFMLGPNTEFFSIMRIGDKPEDVQAVGHVHLTNFQGYTAQIHFSLLPEEHKECVTIGAKVLEALWSIKRPDGTPYVEDLLGLTPSYNRAVIKLYKESGFKELARLKNACYNSENNKYYDGILTIVSRNVTQE